MISETQRILSIDDCTDQKDIVNELRYMKTRAKCYYTELLLTQSYKILIYVWQLSELGPVNKTGMYYYLKLLFKIII